MEKWCVELGFNHNLNDFCKQFQKCCNTRMKLPWKSIIKHVRPMNEAEIIRKQYLYQILCCGKQFDKIEVPVSCPKDYNLYKKMKDDKETLKVIQENLDKKKISIKEYLAKSEISRQKFIIDERQLKVIVYKLNQLKKKKITILRLLNKLASGTEFLDIINKFPNSLVGYGSDMSEWERKISILAKELPRGREYETVLLKLKEILEGYKLSPVPYWDRTETMTSLEKLFLSMFKKMNSCQSTLEKYYTEIERDEQETILLIKQNNEGASNEDILKLLLDFKKNILQDVQDISKELLDCQAPYTLVLEQSAVERLQQKINEKVNNITFLMPVENEEITGNITLRGPVVDLPSQIDVEKLKNSISEEVSLFMKMSIVDSNCTNPNYINIRTGCTSESQYLKLKDDIKNLLKLTSLSKNISSLIISPSDFTTIAELKEKLIESNSNNSKNIQTSSETLKEVTKYYARLKSAFDFLRKEPLNQRLTGIEIADKDINVWLNSYIKIKENLDHAEWLQKNA